MNRRVIVALTALSVAAVGTVAVFAYASGADRRALQGQQTVTAYVATKDVPAGTTARKALDDGLIAQELIARKGVPQGALTRIDGSNDKLVATSELQAGELVLSQRFGTTAATDGRIAVPAGKMAISLSLDDPSHVGTFVGVGSHVAVYDTFNVQETDTKGRTPAGDHLQDRHELTRATRVLVPDVEVLAVGTTTTVASGTAKDASSSSGMQNASSQTPVALLVTLAVTADQAQRLIHAERTGTMTFALLGDGDPPKAGSGVDDRNLFTGIVP